VPEPLGKICRNETHFRLILVALTWLELLLHCAKLDASLAVTNCRLEDETTRAGKHRHASGITPPLPTNKEKR
jgi:hypothetical protein